MAEKIDGADAINVAYWSVRSITNTSRPYKPQETLAWYNLDDSMQAQAIRDTIRNDEQVGLPKYGYTIDSNYLLGISGTMKLIDLILILIERAVEIEG